MLRLIAILWLLPAVAMASINVYTNNTLSLTPGAHPLVACESAPIRYTVFTRQGTTPVDLSNARVVWRLVHLLDQFTAVSVTGSIVDVTNGVWRVATQTPPVPGSYVGYGDILSASSTTVLMRAAWDLVTITARPPASVSVSVGDTTVTNNISFSIGATATVQLVIYSNTAVYSSGVYAVENQTGNVNMTSSDGSISIMGSNGTIDLLALGGTSISVTGAVDGDLEFFYGPGVGISQTNRSFYFYTFLPVYEAGVLQGNVTSLNFTGFDDVTAGGAVTIVDDTITTLGTAGFLTGALSGSSISLTSTVQAGWWTGQVNSVSANGVSNYQGAVDISEGSGIDVTHTPSGVVISAAGSSGGGAYLQTVVATIIPTNGLNTVQGGVTNSAISGGAGNLLANGTESSAIGGGSGNIITAATYSVVSGGRGNIIRYGTPYDAVIAGGQGNYILGGVGHAIGGGTGNSMQSGGGTYGTIGGGSGNIVGSWLSGSMETIGGGNLNKIDARGNNTIGGGYANDIGHDNDGGNHNTIGGGSRNWMFKDTDYNTIGGGIENTIDAASGLGNNTIGGGARNTNAPSATAGNATIGGGYQNRNTAAYTTIGGGIENRNTDQCSTIGGGKWNSNEDIDCTIAGGYGNTNTTDGGTVRGGYFNRTAGYTAEAGGDGCEANANFTWTGGQNAKASHSGVFHWRSAIASLNAGTDLDSTASNQFIISVSGGGVAINTNNHNGRALNVNGDIAVAQTAQRIWLSTNEYIVGTGTGTMWAVSLNPPTTNSL